MMKNRKYLYLITILLILLVGGSIVTFLSITEFNNHFWISYVSSIICLLYLAFSMIYYLKSKDGEEAARFSLITWAILYLVTTGAVTLFGSIWLMKDNLYLALQIGIFVIYLVLLIYNIGSHAYIAAQNTEVKLNKQSANLLKVEIKKIQSDLLNHSTEDITEIKKQLDVLEEKVRFMDPMTNESINDYESKLRSEIMDLRNFIHNSLESSSVDVNIIKRKVQQLIDIIAIRNEILKNSK